MISGTTANFKTDVIDFNGKVLVDFWASWCGPCLMLSPILEEIEKELKDKVKFVKIDADAEIDLTTQYNISSIPTVLIFNNGQLVNTIIGFHQRQDYLKALGQ